MGIKKKAKTLTLDGNSITPTDVSKELSGLGLKFNKTWTLKATDEKTQLLQKQHQLLF